MSKRILSSLLAIWLLGGSWWYTANSTTTSNLDIQKAFGSEEMLLSISKLSTLSKQAINFQANQFEFSVPGDFNSTLVELAYVLKNSKESFLCITGRYAEMEENFSSKENLGLARAEAIKQNLIFWGAPKNKIEIAAIEHIAETTSTIQGVDLQVDGPNEKLFNPLNLYFKANKYKIKVTRPIKDYFKSLRDYLDENPDKKVHITGHSYEGDNRAWNDRVSRYRATEVKKLLVKLGIDEDRIESKFLGKSELMIENGEKEEMAKNRRVEVRIK